MERTALPACGYFVRTTCGGLPHSARPALSHDEVWTVGRGWCAARKEVSRPTALQRGRIPLFIRLWLEYSSLQNRRTPRGAKGRGRERQDRESREGAWRPPPHLDIFSFPLLEGTHSPDAPGVGQGPSLRLDFTPLQIETRLVFKGALDRLAPPLLLPHLPTPTLTPA